LPEQSILIIEDEENLIAALKYNLAREGYQVHIAEDGEQGLEWARQFGPDLIILDIMLPKLDGFEVCRILRQQTDIPILILTAKGEEIDRVVGLELGADDYVVKPFSMRELMARVKAMLRRPRQATAVSPGAAAPLPAIRAGNLEIDRTGHSVMLAGTVLDLKPREFDLLELLVANRGRAFTRDQILERVWGPDWVGDSRTVDVHIRWLREKIETAPGSPQRIITIRGVGYRFIG